MADAPKAGALARLAPSAPAQLANAPAAADVGGNAAEGGAAAAAAAVLPEVEDNDTSTIYVKNLAFATGDPVVLCMNGQSVPCSWVSVTTSMAYAVCNMLQ